MPVIAMTTVVHIKKKKKTKLKKPWRNVGSCLGDVKELCVVMWNKSEFVQNTRQIKGGGERIKS